VAVFVAVIHIKKSPTTEAVDDFQKVNPLIPKK